MALNGITFDPVQIYGKEFKLLAVKWTCDTGGAVGVITGKGFSASPTRNPAVSGTVVENGIGGFEVTLPGSGAIQDLFVVGASWIAGASDTVHVKVNAYSLANRTLDVETIIDDGSPAPTDVTSGEIHLVVLVKNTDVD